MENKKFYVSGPRSLLLAFRQELLDADWREDGDKIIDNTAFTGIEVNKTLYGSMCFVALSYNVNACKEYKLNTDWDLAIQAAKESEEELAFKLAKPYIDRGYVKGAKVMFGNLPNNNIWEIVEFPSMGVYNGKLKSETDLKGSYFVGTEKTAETLKLTLIKKSNYHSSNLCEGSLRYNELITIETVQIGGYIGEFSEGVVRFGCQTFTKDQVSAIYNSFEDITKEKLKIILTQI